MGPSLEKRALSRPERYIVGTVDTFDEIVSRDPLTRTTEIWSVHPGLSRQRLLEPRGRPFRTLLAAIRTRAIDAPRTSRSLAEPEAPAGDICGRLAAPLEGRKLRP